MFQTDLRWMVVLVFFSLALCTTSELATAQSAAPLYPDIVEQISHLQIQNEHQSEMLRFSTTHINIGFGPLQVRGGGQVAPCVIDGIAYAQCTYATQEVLDVNGNIVYSQPSGVSFFHPQHKPLLFRLQCGVTRHLRRMGRRLPSVYSASGVEYYRGTGRCLLSDPLGRSRKPLEGEQRVEQLCVG